MTRESSEPDAKVGYVRKLFAVGPAEYDILLRILSFNRDRHWRNTVIERANQDKSRKVLDIACGTGLVTYSFASNGAYVVGVDVTRQMIKQAMMLPEYQRLNVDFVLARAENLPFVDDGFDASTISLALRNVSSQVETISEMQRCVRKGGVVISLDFARPEGRFFRPFYNFYIFRVLPTLGLLISRHWNTIFLYLANSIDKSRDPEGIRKTMDLVGLQNTSVKRMTLGTTAMVSGSK